MTLWAETAVTATGLNGLTQGRFVGVSTTGPPTTGDFLVGDYALSQNGHLWVCVAAGSPGSWANPSDLRNVLSAGESTMPREELAVNTLATTSQTLRLAYFTARKSETTTQVRVMTGNTAAAATPTLCRIGLYEIATNGDGTLVASTANDTTLFAATATRYTRSWSASYAKKAGRRYAMGILVVTSATAPTMMGASMQATAGAEFGEDPRLCGSISGQTDLPSSFAAASSADTTVRHYGAILV